MIEGGLEAPAAHVALVTGASRGVGRGIALGLLAAGFRVYGSGRSIEQADLPPHRGTGLMDAGVRAAFVCSARAARMMTPRRGVITNISFWSAQRHLGNTIYGIAKAATDKMTSDTAVELEPSRLWSFRSTPAWFERSPSWQRRSTARSISRPAKARSSSDA